MTDQPSGVPSKLPIPSTCEFNLVINIFIVRISMTSVKMVSSKQWQWRWLLSRRRDLWEENGHCDDQLVDSSQLKTNIIRNHAAAKLCKIMQKDANNINPDANYVNYTCDAGKKIMIIVIMISMMKWMYRSTQWCWGNLGEVHGSQSSVQPGVDPDDQP